MDNREIENIAAYYSASVNEQFIRNIDIANLIKVISEFILEDKKTRKSITVDQPMKILSNIESSSPVSEDLNKNSIVESLFSDSESMYFEIIRRDTDLNDDIIKLIQISEKLAKAIEIISSVRQ